MNVDSGMPNQNCSSRYPSLEYLCFFGEIASIYIATPFYIMQSEYDSWQLTRSLGIHCINSQESLSNCSETELGQIALFRKVKNCQVPIKFH